VSVAPKARSRTARAILAIATFFVPSVATAADPLDIYVLLPMTGNVAFIGTPESQSLHAVEAWANRTGGVGGRPVRFVVEDDQSNPQVDVQLATQIIAKRAPVVLGPVMTAQCNAISPLMKDGPVAFCLTSGVHPPAGSFVFGFGASTEQEMIVAMRYFSATGLKRIAVLVPNDATGQDGAQNIEAVVATDRTLSIVDKENFTPTDTTVTAQLSRIAAANPQVLIAWTTGGPLSTILRGVREAGLDIPVLTTPGNISYIQMKQYAPFLPHELVFPGPLFLALDQISDRTTKGAIQTFYGDLATLGFRPDQTYNSIYDAAVMIVRAFRTLGPDATADQVRGYLANLKDWHGINGAYDFPKFPQRGMSPSSVVMVHWDQAKGTWTAISKPGGNPLK